MFSADREGLTIMKPRDCSRAELATSTRRSISAPLFCIEAEPRTICGVSERAGTFIMFSHIAWDWSDSWRITGDRALRLRILFLLTAFFTLAGEGVSIFRCLPRDCGGVSACYEMYFLVYSLGSGWLV